MRYEGEEHLARIREKQYALVAHLKTDSELADAREAKANGTCPSLSAFFMLNLIDQAL